MTQPFADALTWVPKSRALGATLGRAHDLARAQGHGAVTLEHMLLSLIEDPDASALLLSCNVDLLSLNRAVAAHLQLQPGGEPALPGPAPALLTILEYAVTAARQSRRTEINGAIVVAAIVGEGTSEAARLLQAGGLRFEEAVLALRRSVGPRTSAAEVSRAAPPMPTTEPQSPPMIESGSTFLHEPPLPGSAGAPIEAPAETPAPTVAFAPTAQGAVGADPAAPARPYTQEREEDPVTTARRRIAAIRSGQPPPVHAQPIAPAAVAMPSPANSNMQMPAPPQVPMPGGAAAAMAAFPAPVEPASTNWTPAPLPQTMPPARSLRMPPPVPPIAEAPLRSNGPLPQPSPAVQVPWGDPGLAATAAEPAVDVIPPRPHAGPPIEPARLAERIPERMQARVPVTVEIRIPRSAVLATAGAVQRDTTLTRALAVRLKAPAGGFHIENAAPETQWFDTRAAPREDDEVRWRWLVTPHRPGNKPLLLSISMRTIAADGIGVETPLPEASASVRIGRNHLVSLKTHGTWIAAALAGAIAALLATGGWGLLVR